MGSRGKKFSNTYFFQLLHVFFWNDSTSSQQYILHVLLLHQVNGMQHRLGATHRKHRHYGHATACRDFFQGRGEFGHQIFMWVHAVAVGGLDDQIIGLRHGLGLDFNPTCFAHPFAADGFTYPKDCAMSAGNSPENRMEKKLRKA